MELFGIIALVVAVALAIRLCAGSLDGGRIDEYIQSRGGKVITREWSPFGRGWFGERSDRLYKVEYVDRDGNRRSATVKTSLFTGVYFTEDRIVNRGEMRAAEEAEIDRLREENAALRARLDPNRGADA